MHDRNQEGQPFDRRVFLRSGVIFTGAVLASSALLRGAETKNKDEEKEAQVGPPEDLMREHGVLKRVLLIYGEVLRRIGSKQDFPPEALADAARIIRNFVEDYHEKLEEDFLFPRFEKANLLADLVKVLRAQHQAGRQVTDVTMRFANLQSLKNESERGQLITSMQQFIRMYNPHEAREDTILFPAFRKIVSPHEFDALGEDFEKKEDELFGEDGFEKVVDKVAGIEQRLGIYDLAQFTPKILRIVRELFITDAPAATILVRIMTGGVFLSEGIQKFLYPEDLAAGRFAKIGIPSPEILGPFVGGCEVVCGVLLIIGLLTRLAAIVLLIDISVAIISTKIPVLLGHGFWGFSLMKLPRYGFWSMMHEARTDFSMWLGLLFLVIVGASRWSVDAALMRRRTRSQWPTASR